MMHHGQNRGKQKTQNFEEIGVNVAEIAGIYNLFANKEEYAIGIIDLGDGLSWFYALPL